MHFKKIFITAILLLICSACSNEKIRNDDLGTKEYEQVKKIAWEYLEEQGWNNRVEGHWEKAKVQILEVNEGYIIFNQNYLGQNVYSVSFEDKGNLVVGSPSILVSKDYEVIGYSKVE